jgi:hypothetical protein
MLDFSQVRTKRKTMNELAEGLTLHDLRALTNEMIDAQLNLIADCTDADVTLVPIDPKAKDDAAAKPEDVNIAWTLGHVIVHTTASSEEYAFLATEMARGVPNHGRSRYETPWETIHTLTQCRARLEESRRIRTALLNVWPDAPHTEVTHEPWPGAGPRHCFAQFIGGLSHEDSHLGQIAEVVRQAKAARTA